MFVLRVPFSGGPNFDFRKAYWSVRQAYADVLSQPTEEKEVGQRFGGGFWESVSLWFPFESQPKRGPPIGEKTSRWTCALLHSFRVALLLFLFTQKASTLLAMVLASFAFPWGFIALVSLEFVSTIFTSSHTSRGNCGLRVLSIPARQSGSRT